MPARAMPTLQPQVRAGSRRRPLPVTTWGFDRVAAALDQEAAHAHHERVPIGDVNKRFAAALATATTFVPEFDGRELMAAALVKAYAKGQGAMASARTTLSTPDLHRWRKAVKGYWHLVRLARTRLPKRITETAADLDRLGEALGLGNDHALLAEKLALSPTGDPALMRQLALIAKRRNALEAEAFALGDRIYATKPKAFARKLKLK